MERNRFAKHVGLALVNTWWLVEIDVPQGQPPREDEKVPQVPGALATFAQAPPVYDPGGPMLLLHDVTDTTAVAAALTVARERGCAGMVVDVREGVADLREPIETAGARAHCHFYEGRL